MHPLTPLKAIEGPSQQGNYQSGMCCFTDWSLASCEDDPPVLQLALLSDNHFLLLSVQGTWVNSAVVQSERE